MAKKNSRKNKSGASISNISNGLSRKWAWGLIAVGVAAAVYLLVVRESTSMHAIPEAGAEALALGRQLYAQNCAVCHGAEAGGENPATPMGGDKPGGGTYAPALNGTGHAWHHPPGALFSVIRNGSPTKGSTMAGWAGRMSDTEIRAVIAYVQSLWPEEITNMYRNRHGD